MNKIININLGGKPFTIDDNAYEYLQKYMNSLKQYFKDYEEKEDIIYDIEARLGEIFEERLVNRSIVGMHDVEEAMEQMGTPEDFENDMSAEQKTAGTHRMRDHRENKKQDKYRVGRKLMRDPENKKIAGVCSGLAAYFGMSDPLLIRVLFLVLLFTGLGPIPYIILWILMPTPKTAADRLAMKGEDINYDNIAKEVHQEWSDLKERLSNIGK
ncbi:MAG TPA: PspC domain-containing protein [Saprospiraceae bacterium]|nr:PspC domain-containing protein [Saprospiraceae bacterium]